MLLHFCLLSKNAQHNKHEKQASTDNKYKPLIDQFSVSGIYWHQQPKENITCLACGPLLATEEKQTLASAFYEQASEHDTLLSWIHR